MLQLLLRLAFGTVAILTLIEGMLPEHLGSARISRHTSDTSGEVSHYTLHFAEGRPKVCEVSEETYNRVRDGQRITLHSSALFKLCLGITADGETFHPPFHWYFMRFCLLLTALGVGFGPFRLRRPPPRASVQNGR